MKKAQICHFMRAMFSSKDYNRYIKHGYAIGQSLKQTRASRIIIKSSLPPVRNSNRSTFYVFFFVKMWRQLFQLLTIFKKPSKAMLVRFSPKPLELFHRTDIPILKWLTLFYSKISINRISIRFKWKTYRYLIEV